MAMSRHVTQDYVIDRCKRNKCICSKHCPCERMKSVQEKIDPVTQTGETKKK